MCVTAAACNPVNDNAVVLSKADALAPNLTDGSALDTQVFDPIPSADDSVEYPADTVVYEIIPAPDSVRVVDTSLAPPIIFGDDRPARLQVPSSYDPATPIPLVVILHGYYFNPGYVIAGFQMESFFEDIGVLTIAPEGLVNLTGNHFWNGSPSCCDFFGSNVDDVAYLSTLIESIQVAYTVDARRIYAIGHSNGAFMANTLACERPDLLAGVISVAGAANPACTPAGEVSVLHVHATGDDSIFYEGGMLNGAVYPGAVGTAEYWAQANGCSLESEVIGAIDFNQFVPGAESEMARYIACPEGIDVDLWTEPGGPHMPRLPVGFYLKWWEWMNAHPKPE